MIKFIVSIGFILCFSQLAFSQQWLSGTWEGKGYQTTSDETWTMRLRKQKKKFFIEYPSLQCSGEWKLVSFNKSRARFRENIRVNKESCEPRGNVILQRLNRNQLMFLYSFRGRSEIVASAVLNRAK